jgi:hypothetical protein
MFLRNIGNYLPDYTSGGHKSNFYYSALKMETAGSFETLVTIYQTIHQEGIRVISTTLP